MNIFQALNIYSESVIHFHGLYIIKDLLSQNPFTWGVGLRDRSKYTDEKKREKKEQKNGEKFLLKK